MDSIGRAKGEDVTPVFVGEGEDKKLIAEGYV